MCNTSHHVGVVIVCPRVGTGLGLRPGTELGDCGLCGSPVWIEPAGRQLAEEWGQAVPSTLCFDCAFRGLDRLTEESDPTSRTTGRGREGGRTVLSYGGAMGGVPWKLRLFGLSMHQVILATPATLARIAACAAGVVGPLPHRRPVRRP